ncbi:hypothetical protein M3Y98_00230800 [Aphelenchoides besseyi]|nr:hypothetical protein M3Y98_00230800 [Aphelenchoides besseyi]KAI6200586.1 hypothetical protein M3Y96_00749700 [Aphelenchoides besseyi]
MVNLTTGARLAFNRFYIGHIMRDVEKNEQLKVFLQLLKLSRIHMIEMNLLYRELWIKFFGDEWLVEFEYDSNGPKRASFYMDNNLVAFFIRSLTTSFGVDLSTYEDEDGYEIDVIRNNPANVKKLRISNGSPEELFHQLAPNLLHLESSASNLINAPQMKLEVFKPSSILIEEEWTQLARHRIHQLDLSAISFDELTDFVSRFVIVYTKPIQQDFKSLAIDVDRLDLLNDVQPLIEKLKACFPSVVEFHLTLRGRAGQIDIFTETILEFYSNILKLCSALVDMLEKLYVNMEINDWMSPDMDFDICWTQKLIKHEPFNLATSFDDEKTQYMFVKHYLPTPLPTFIQFKIEVLMLTEHEYKDVVDDNLDVDLELGYEFAEDDQYEEDWSGGEVLSDFDDY